MKKPRITVVGSNMVDLITYIERMPEVGETIVAPSFDMGFGGKGANQAVAAALLGADVGMVTKVGADLFGPNTRANFERYGIDTTFVESVEGVSSGVAPIFVGPDANNSILIVKGANEHLATADVDRAESLIKNSDIVIMQLEIRLETIYHTIELCGRHNVPVLLNPAPADPNLEITRISGVRFFMPNETELKTITGMPVDTLDNVRKAAHWLVGQGVPEVVVTIGERGSMYVTSTSDRILDGHRVESRDSTGAGDAFIGCFAVYFVETGSVEQAMERANIYAALSTMRPGTQKSLLDRESLEAYMAGL
ncbi:MAG: ribokinase [Spirochaetaceae bacterium]|nr:MAG: ribokinase [Spirochaetaceae bacterium]